MTQGDRNGQTRPSANPRGRLAPLAGKQSTWHRASPHSVPARPQDGQTHYRARTALRHGVMDGLTVGQRCVQTCLLLCLPQLNRGRRI